MSAGEDEAKIVPTRSDVWWGIGWFVFGIAVTWGAIKMDRLEHLHINPYTIPGLLPGILGIFIAFFGVILAIRAIRGGAFARQPVLSAEEQAEARISWQRVGTTIAVCLVFALGLIGHGLPFWASAAVFIFAFVTIFQWKERGAANQRLRGLVMAAAVAIGGSAVITFIFQELFLVRLP